MPRDILDAMSLDNAVLAELLARAAEKHEGHRARALRRAARRAFLWPEEAADLVAAGRRLDELEGVGPWIARQLASWLADPPAVPDPPPARRGFRTLAAARRRLTCKEPPPLQGDLQCHTTWSDGHDSVRAMAEAAAERGYAYLAITDHSRGLKIANGLDARRLAEQRREIADINADLAASGSSLRLLHGLEMNLDPRGAGDMEPQDLEGLDLVLGAFHSALRRTSDETERYLAALRNPHFHVLAHPRGRVFDRRKGLDADWRRVFAEAARRGKAVEVDAYPDRQDLDVERLAICREEGPLVSLGTDAHSSDQLAWIELGLAAVLEAGIPLERVLNFRSRERLFDGLAR